MELMTEILARVSVKSLLRFRRVCKSWHSLISSPDLAYLHLARYHNDDDDNSPILTFICHDNIVRWNLRSTHSFPILTACTEIGDKALVFSQSIPTLGVIKYYLSKLTNQTREELVEI